MSLVFFEFFYPQTNPNQIKLPLTKIHI